MDAREKRNEKTAKRREGQPDKDNEYSYTGNVLIPPPHPHGEVRFPEGKVRRIKPLIDQSRRERPPVSADWPSVIMNHIWRFFFKFFFSYSVCGGNKTKIINMK